MAVPIQVAEDRAAHQADVGQAARVLRIDLEFAANVAKQSRGSREGILSRQTPAADKEIEQTIAIHVGQGHRASARLAPGQTFVRRFFARLILPRATPLAQAIFVIRRPDDQRRLRRIFCPSEHGGLVARDRAGERRFEAPFKTPAAIVAIHRQRTAAPAADDQVFPPIAIQIEPRDTRTELAQAIRQQRLARIVIERLVLMSVVKPRAHVLKQRRRSGGLAFGRRVLGRAGSGLVDFVDSIWPRSRNHALPAVAPGDFDAQLIGERAGGEHPHRIIGG